jgi:hypothetical protein
MKKRSKKLSLHRETLRDLNPDHLTYAVGGNHTEEDTCPATCAGTCTCSCVSCDTCRCTARTCPP